MSMRKIFTYIVNYLVIYELYANFATLNCLLCFFYVMKSLRYTSVHSKVMNSRCYDILRKLVFIFKYCLLVQHVHLL